MIDWINMNIPYLCVVDTGELAGDPPDLAAGINDDFTGCSVSWLAF
jgi:hypothetical protein